MKRPPLDYGHVAAQRGAASLVVVMLLCFVLSLTAAYAGRNLIFEQKTSANQLHSTTAFEAAEAGIEWTLAQLNGGLIDDRCTDTWPTTSFQQRYLSIDASTGLVAQAPRAVGDASPRLWPTCVFNGADWDCTCPVAAEAEPAAPSGAGPHPAFRVWPATPEPTLAAVPPAHAASSPWVAIHPARAGFVPINSVGCTRLPAAGETCLEFVPGSDMGEGIAYQRAILVLRSGLAMPPTAAVTAGRAVAPAPAPAPPLRVVNTDRRSGGFSVHYAEAGLVPTLDPSRFVVETVAGTPPALSFRPDSGLADLATVAPASAPPAPPSLTGGERVFVSVFGMKRATYRQQPGLRVCPQPCAATDVNLLMQHNPDRIIWVEGNLRVNADIGAGGPPALLIVNGDTITLDADHTVRGLVYITGNGSATSTLELPDAPTRIEGALVAEGDLVTHYAGPPANGSQLTVAYDAAALDRLRLNVGSWVRLGAAWRDFKEAP